MRAQGKKTKFRLEQFMEALLIVFFMIPMIIPLVLLIMLIWDIIFM